MKVLDYQGNLADSDALAEHLSQAGLSPAACREKAVLFAEAAKELGPNKVNPENRTIRAFFVPGRIEVLGKHTDYAGGRSIVAAAERGFCLIASPRNDSRVQVADALLGESTRFQLDLDIAPDIGHWSNYPMTVARRIAKNFPGACRGADMAFASDLPPAAGMSSSSALMVATFLALADVNRLAERGEYQQDINSPTDLAEYLGAIENGQTFGSLEGDRGVGTFGGSEDHTAILTAEPNRASEYYYCPIRFVRTIPIPEKHIFAIGVSGVVAEKTGAAKDKYNAASRRASGIAELWRKATGRDDPHLAAALESEPGAAARLKSILSSARYEEFGPEPLLSRLEHFITESEETLPLAGDTLARGDVNAFGSLVDRSQKAAEQLLGNQIPETIHMAACARASGAPAASSFGAGFGGGVWALLPEPKAEGIINAWTAAYRAKFPKLVEESSFFTTRAGPAAFRVC